ncbi:MAG: prepilin-type N-terminal cleavage/methylation domain-containing protein [Puniceicoccales bacterium]|jgi:hypothetical protein|nr:prepilin-type N-terminal cleavage/methylation domain-containing protein [Puniceicoccales bacterium]
MKNKNKAFSLVEIIISMIIFAGAMGTIFNGYVTYLRVIKMPKRNETAKYMIADINNCVSNIDHEQITIPIRTDNKLRSNLSVFCLLAGKNSFNASKMLLSSPLSTLKHYNLIITKYPAIGDAAPNESLIPIYKYYPPATPQPKPRPNPKPKPKPVPEDKDDAAKKGKDNKKPIHSNKPLVK